MNIDPRVVEDMVKRLELEGLGVSQTGARVEMRPKTTARAPEGTDPADLRPGEIFKNAIRAWHEGSESAVVMAHSLDGRVEGKAGLQVFTRSLGIEAFVPHSAPGFLDPAGEGGDGAASPPRIWFRAFFVEDPFKLSSAVKVEPGDRVTLTFTTVVRPSAPSPRPASARGRQRGRGAGAGAGAVESMETIEERESQLLYAGEFEVPADVGERAELVPFSEPPPDGCVSAQASLQLVRVKDKEGAVHCCVGGGMAFVRV